MKNLTELVRPNILALEPYSCARDEFKGRQAHVFLDANESPYNAPYDRYPAPVHEDLREMLADMKGVRPEQIFMGNGSDEAIDLVYRIFCRPGVDNVVAMTPTYGMYQVCADINDVEYRPVLLSEDYVLDPDKLLQAVDGNTKVIWLCSPNNPTGAALSRSSVERVLREFDGIVVIDEAYSDFCRQRPFRLDLDRYPNLVVFNTMSKAWASAAIRLGMAFASEEIISIFNKVKYPYNINMLTCEQAKRILSQVDVVSRWVSGIVAERERMIPALSELPFCQKVYPSDANFLLIRVDDADAIYHYLVDQGVIVRNRNKVALCGNCLRVTIGTADENCELLRALRCYK
ncbi:MAG: histidinol-phosphate transaminase [Bacteroidaceae bacterium]